LPYLGPVAGAAIATKRGSIPPSLSGTVIDALKQADLPTARG
jgi:hypothetical protein